jgi:transposase
MFANSRAESLLGALPGRLARRRGKQKAIAATGNSLLTVSPTCSSMPMPDLAISGLETRNLASTNPPRPRSGHQLQALTGQHIVIRGGKPVITDTAV